MPSVYCLICTECQMEKSIGFLNVPFVILDDDRRIDLPHPFEDKVAMGHTGLNVRQLRKVNRIGNRRVFACERCWDLQLFAEDEFESNCKLCGHSKRLWLGDLIGKTSSHLLCGKCRSGTLILKVVGQS